MRRLFLGYYDPTPEEIEDAWENSVFAFDANVLLNLYRYSDTVRNDFFNTFNALKERLFLPYQAGYEFHKNRLTVIYNIESIYDVLKKRFKDLIEKEKQNQDINKKHPLINVNTFYDELFSVFLRKLERLQKRHPDFKNDDIVLEKVNELFAASIGTAFDKKDLEEIFKEGKDRYSKQIPPGYMDEKDKAKEPLQSLYGDLIIWKELIRFSTPAESKSIIFITDDRKEDWWLKIKGQTVGPRHELIQEFYNETGKRIHLYNADRFLHFVKKRGILPGLNKSTIEEVKEVREADEKFQITFEQLRKLKENVDAWQRSIYNSENLTQWQIKVPDLSKNLDLIRGDTVKISDWYGSVSEMLNSSVNKSTFADIVKQNEAFRNIWVQAYNDIVIPESDSNSCTEIPKSLEEANLITDKSDISAKESTLKQKPTRNKKSESDLNSNKKKG